MTIAVCIKCGSLKTGAFNVCRGCSFRPVVDTDLAHSLGLTDHYLSREVLERISGDIGAGRFRPTFLPDQERVLLDAVRDPELRKMLSLPSNQGESNLDSEIERLRRTDLYEALCMYIEDRDIELGVDHFKVARHPASPLRRALPYFNQAKVIRQGRDYALGGLENWEALWRIGALSIRYTQAGMGGVTGPNDDWAPFLETAIDRDESASDRVQSFEWLRECISDKDIQLIVSPLVVKKNAAVRKRVDQFPGAALGSRCHGYALSSVERWDELWRLGALKLQRKVQVSDSRTSEGWSLIQVRGPADDWVKFVRQTFCS